jgi:uncharacterized protein YjgD (DUF1641 family)
MNNTNTPNNITFFLEETVGNNRLENDSEIQKMLKGFEDEFNKEAFNPVKEGSVDTVKDLLKICQYYGIDKNIKASKCKKQDIISTIVFFESLPENDKIVNKRHKMWACISELLSDPKMKKYIIWT